MVSKKYQLIIAFIFIFMLGMGGGYLYFSKRPSSQPPITKETKETGVLFKDNLLILRIYYPLKDRLQMEERKVQGEMFHKNIAASVIREFLKGPSNVRDSDMPKDVELLGLYEGSDGILYIDLSDEFRRNFSGDAASEFLLLKGLYESIMANVQNINDVKLLIEGKEIDSLVGHVYLLYPLKDIVSQAAEDGQ